MTVTIKIETLHSKLSDVCLFHLHLQHQLTIFDRLLNADAAAPICICLGHANMRNTLMKFACMRNTRDGGPSNSQ